MPTCTDRGAHFFILEPVSPVAPIPPPHMRGSPGGLPVVRLNAVPTSSQRTTVSSIRSQGGREGGEEG